MRTIFKTISAAFLFIASAAQSEEAKFKIQGDTLFYSTEDEGITKDFVSISDALHFRTILRDNPEILRINLYSYGGHVEAGLEIARIVSDFEIDTEISKECSSACVPIFLAGQNRVLKKGALIGFHRPNWQQDSMERYYDAKKEDFGWNTPFEFSNWVQKDTFEVAMQLYDRFSQAGVAPEFISQALKYDIEQMWYPSRTELVNFGVVNLVELAAMRPPTRPTNIKKIEEAFQEVQISQLEQTE